MSRRRLWFGLGALALGLIVLAACGKQAASTEINVLCTPQEEWCQGMKQEFEEKKGDLLS